MVSQRFIVGFNDVEPSADFLKLVAKYKFGGVIFFERNFKSAEHLAENISRIKALSPTTIFAIDEEGGIKSRLRKEHNFPNPPDPRETAQTITPAETRETYRVCGAELKNLGININFAPVLDIAPCGHILGNRAFSDNPQICAKYGAAAIEGLLDSGIAACAKHFPGLGSATIDPHLKTAFANGNADFADFHFIPFEAAIEAGVPTVMTTHLVAEKLDDTGTIATFSPTVVKILRDTLGFDGVIFSDDLLMGGVGSPEMLLNTTFATLESGHDMILICREVPNLPEIIEFSEKVFGPTQENKTSLERIKKLKDRFVAVV